MEPISQEMPDLIKKIIVAAERWAREVLRSDESLNSHEYELCMLVMEYTRKSKLNFEMPIELPSPPKMPNDLMRQVSNIPNLDSDDREKITSRYSESPTRPSPPKGIPAVKTKDWTEIKRMQIEEDIEDLLW